MLEKNTKISVLRKMIGVNQDEEPHFIVPQNSVSNLRKFGLSEMPISSQSLTPIDTCTRNSQPLPGGKRCPHCENMAKNFLYLESLIRSNFNPKLQCSLCYSSLKYLEYVNKSILEVFGDFDSIVEAARAFAKPQFMKRPKTVQSVHLAKIKSNTPQIKTNTSLVKSGSKITASSKQRIPKKKSKSKVNKQKSNVGSSYSITSSRKSLKIRGKSAVKKGGKSKVNVRAGEGDEKKTKNAKGNANTNANTAANKKKKVVKTKSNAILRGLKSKNIKAKRNKISLVRVAA